MKTQAVFPSRLKRGDTILIDGVMHTIGKDTIKTGFCGTLVRGQQHKTVQRVLFPRFYRGAFVAWVAQP